MIIVNESIDCFAIVRKTPYLTVYVSKLKLQLKNITSITYHKFRLCCPIIEKIENFNVSQKFLLNAVLRRFFR